MSARMLYVAGCLPVASARLLLLSRWAYTEVLAYRRRTAYYSSVPEKKGARFDSLNTQSAQTAPCGFFMCVCLRAPSMSGGGGEVFGPAGLFGCQSVNPAICRSPRLTAGCGLTATQGGSHA